MSVWTSRNGPLLAILPDFGCAHRQRLCLQGHQQMKDQGRVHQGISRFSGAQNGHSSIGRLGVKRPKQMPCQTTIPSPNGPIARIPCLIVCNKTTIHCFGPNPTMSSAFPQLHPPAPGSRLSPLLLCRTQALMLVTHQPQPILAMRRQHPKLQCNWVLLWGTLEGLIGNHLPKVKSQRARAQSKPMPFACSRGPTDQARL